MHIAKYQASLKVNILTNTEFSYAGPSNKPDPFYILVLGWLDKRQDLVHLDLHPPFLIQYTIQSRYYSDLKDA
eukprot:1151187-Pelagomonas_calceolata.AAC.2